MIRILLFASLREQLKSSHYDIALGDGEHTVTTVIHALSASLSEQLGAELAGQCLLLLQAENTLYAVNQEVAAMNTLVLDGDEVAFYPPVTGG